MHLYLSNEDQATEVHGISLRDGCYPCIGDRTLCVTCDDDDEEMQGFLEPAVWFKVLIIDSISIDCKRRCILWNSVPPPNVDRDSVTIRPSRRQYRNRVSESMFMGGECCGDSSDLDEVFDITGDVLEEFMEGLITDDQFHDAVFMLLHCYVLPYIYISRHNLVQAKQATGVLEKAIKAVDEKILIRNTKVENIRSAIHKQTANFVDEILKANDLLNYPTDFVEQLLSDVSLLIEKILHQMDVVQGHVEELKAKTKDEKFGGEQLQGLLKEKRKERDSCVQRYQNLLYVREGLKEFSRESRSKPRKRSKAKRSKSSPAPLYQMYIGMHFEMKELVNEAKRFMGQKVLILSIKEALRTALVEVTDGEDSYGVHIHTPSLCKATDVLRRSKVPPQWLSLSELVARMVNNETTEIGARFIKFCADITNRCHAAVFERELLDAAAASATQNEEEDDSVCIDAPVSSEGQAIEMKTVQKGHASSEPIPMASSGGFARPLSSESLGSMCVFEASSEDLISRNSLSFENLRLTMDPTTKRKNSQPGCLPFTRFQLRSLSDSPYGSPSSTDTGSPALQKSFQIGDSSESKEDEVDKSLTSALSVEEPDDDDLVIIYDTEKNYMRKSINVIKDQILAHFEVAVRSLQKSLSREGDTYYRKIWQVYEKLLFANVMKPLVMLYQVEYAHISSNLAQTVPLLCISDLELEGSSILSILEGGEQRQLQDPLKMTLSTIAEDLDSPRSDSKDKQQSRRSLNKIIRQLSSNVEKGLEAPPSKIYVYHPVSSNVLNESGSWSKPNDTLPEASAEEGLEATLLNESQIVVDIPDGDDMPEISPGSLNLKPEYQQKFRPIFTCIESAVSETSPLQKLQMLTKCLREMEISFFRTESWGHSSPPGSDDLVDMLVVLLCNCQPSLLGQLYVQVVVLSDILAPFYTAGPFNFTLVQFLVAFQFLQEKLVLKKKREAVSEA